MATSYLKKNIKYYLIRNKIIKCNKFPIENSIICKTKPNLYLFYVACGTNMGDHAIVRAEKEFINNCLGYDVNIVEIRTNQTESAILYLKKNIKENDIIILSGGGYIGDEYIEIYSPLKKILKYFKNYRTIIFPQTICFFKQSNESKFATLCKKHKNLEIFVREDKSREIFTKIGINVHLVPDIVLSVTPQTHISNNEILLCMRNDVEKKLSNLTVKEIQNVLNEYGNVIVTDTVEKNIFSMKDRFTVLDNMLNNFSNSKLVVTDRIHGMIFSYLTNTPCLVFGNYNHKVEYEYLWIKECSNIKFISNFDKTEFKKLIEYVLVNKKTNNESLKDKFIKLEEVLRLYYEQ